MEWAPLRNLDCLFPLVPGMAEVTLLDGRAQWTPMGRASLQDADVPTRMRLLM